MKIDEAMGKEMRCFVSVLLVLLANVPMQGRERVYLSTDRNAYLAGEDLWCSVYCVDAETGKYSTLSSVAYVEFHSSQGLEERVKLPMIEGRGCGRLQIPLDFATGNYLLVAYTGKYGGDSKGPFNGKIVSVYNTVTAEKVPGGVELAEQPDAIVEPVQYGMLQVVARVQGDAVPVRVENLSGRRVSLDISVFHFDELERQAIWSGSFPGPLTERGGEFEVTDFVDYAGEVIRIRVTPQKWSPNWYKGVYVYMSAKGNEDDLYVGRVDSLGFVTYYTNNVSGNKDLMIEVVDNVTQSARLKDYGQEVQRYSVELVEREYRHIPGEIPVLKLHEGMGKVLQTRNIRMQITRRFDADSLFDLMPMRVSSYLGATQGVRYRLDDYTRFPVMEDVVREYVAYLRVRSVDGKRVLKVVNQDGTDFAWSIKGEALALLDGVPVRDQEKIINMDPLLVKEIVVYPRQIVLNHFVYDGVVKFNTYKGDMGGVQMGENFCTVPHKGVQYPLAFLGSGIADNVAYPNYNPTLYWNPLVDLEPGGVFEFSCPLPKYKGKFKIAVEGLDSGGEPIYRETIVTNE